MIEAVKNAAVSVLVSAMISGIGIYYLQRYLDDKHRESEDRARTRRAERQRADVLESKRRRAAGRLFFWLHYAATRGVDAANGDLTKAFEDYNAADNEQRAFEQELLAEHHDENRGGNT